MIEFSATFGVLVQLAYYPPYHSKYNPIERVFGVLENYWNGDPLRSSEQALGMAAGMTYKGIHPQVTLIEKTYAKGVKLDKKTMKPYENCLERSNGLSKWSIIIKPEVATAMMTKKEI